MDVRRNSARTTCGTALAIVAMIATAAATPAEAAEAGRQPSGPSSPTQATDCRVRALPVPDGLSRTRVTAGDPTGHMLAGTGVDGASQIHVVLWENHVPRVLDAPAESLEVTSVSRNGTIGGFLYVNPNIGFVITPAGAYREVTAPDAGVYVDGVTDDRTAAGSVLVEGLPHPAVWQRGAYDEPTTLRVPGGYSAVVTGMAEDGSIAVSTAFVGDQPLLAYAWTADGDRKRLRGTPGGEAISVNAIADRHAAGFEWDPDAGVSRILRWRLPSGRVTAFEMPGEFHSMSVDAVNRHGVIGGQVLDGPPALIVGDDLVELPPLAPGMAAGVLAVASNGRAAGWSRDDDLSINAVTWRCS